MIKKMGIYKEYIYTLGWTKKYTIFQNNAILLVELRMKLAANSRLYNFLLQCWLQKHHVLAFFTSK